MQPLSKYMLNEAELGFNPAVFKPKAIQSAIEPMRFYYHALAPDFDVDKYFPKEQRTEEYVCQNDYVLAGDYTVRKEFAKVVAAEDSPERTKIIKAVLAAWRKMIKTLGSIKPDAKTAIQVLEPMVTGKDNHLKDYQNYFSDRGYTSYVIDAIRDMEAFEKLPSTPKGVDCVTIIRLAIQHIHETMNDNEYYRFLWKLWNAGGITAENASYSVKIGDLASRHPEDNRRENFLWDVDAEILGEKVKFEYIERT